MFAPVRGGSRLCTQLVLARHLSPADLGMFFAVTSLVAVTGMVVVQGYPSLAVRFVSRYRDNPKLLGAFVRESSGVALRWAVLASGTILLGAAVWPGLSAQDRIGLAIGAFTVLPMAALNVHSAFAARCGASTSPTALRFCFGPLAFSP
jgi:O-antigen/teichoic acid export membrane protein